ncbi:MAG: hypothetical protein MUF48_22035 [Pirellulaceae bacterium]|nr:hypothetical protein [Pirellulaceae bacterium]
MNLGNASRPLSRLEQSIVWRLLAAGKPATKSDLDKALKRYFADRVALPAARWREALAQSLERLRAEGLIETTTCRLTESGRLHALRALSVTSLPSQVTWTTLRNRHVMAVALGIQPHTKTEWDRLGSAAGLRAAILARHYRLPLGPVPSLSRVLHALAWLQLKEGHTVDLPLDKDFSRNAVLGVTLLRGSASKRPEEVLAAQLTRAGGTQLEKVREAVICNWVAAEHATPPPGLSGGPKAGFDLAAFAAQVMSLARTATTGWFGDHKVFIAHVWDRFRQQPEAVHMARAEFDSHLVEANRADLLTLSRADLVSGMDADDVRRSEIRLPHSSFHFIRTDRTTP